MDEAVASRLDRLMSAHGGTPQQSASPRTITVPCAELDSVMREQGGTRLPGLGRARGGTRRTAVDYDRLAAAHGGHLSTDPNAGQPVGYVSTDPDAEEPVAAFKTQKRTRRSRPADRRRDYRHEKTLAVTHHGGGRFEGGRRVGHARLSP